MIGTLVDAAALGTIGTVAARRRARPAVARAARTRLASAANAIAAGRSAVEVGRGRLWTGCITGEVRAAAGRVARTGRMIAKVAGGIRDQLGAHRTAVAATSRPLARGSVAGERCRGLRLQYERARGDGRHGLLRRPAGRSGRIVDDRARSEHCDQDDDERFHRSSLVMKQHGSHDRRAHPGATGARQTPRALAPRRRAFARAMPARQPVGTTRRGHTARTPDRGRTVERRYDGARPAVENFNAPWKASTR